MKIEQWRRLALLFVWLSAAFVQAAPHVATFPIVTVQAAMPLASEPGNNPAVFTFNRYGNTNEAISVTFNIGGTASNGVDYAAITNAVNFAAGQTSAQITSIPVDEPSAVGFKTIILTLPRHSLLRHAEPSFVVGSVARAVAYIAYNYSNVPPAISLVSPSNTSSYFSRPNILLNAKAVDSNGWITSVKFVANGSTVGIVSNRAPEFAIRESRGSILLSGLGNREERFPFVWTNVAPGNYSLTAIATDNSGLETTAAAVTVEVTTNLPTPAVRIVSPSSGSEFPNSFPINIYAAASETNGVVNTVEFLANGNSLGLETNYLAGQPLGHLESRTPWVPFYFRWTNAPVGSNSLTVVVTDNNGLQATSAPVSITISTNSFHTRHPRW